MDAPPDRLLKMVFAAQATLAGLCVGGVFALVLGAEAAERASRERLVPLGSAAREFEINLLDYVLEITLAAADQGRPRHAIRENAQAVDVALTNYTRLAASDGERQVAARLAAEWAQVTAAGGAALAGDTAAARRTVELAQRLELLLDDVVQPDATRLLTESERLVERRMALAVATAGATAALGVLLTVVFGMRVARRVEAQHTTLARESAYCARLFEGSPGLACVVDDRGIIRRANAAFLALAGPDATGRLLVDMVAAEHRDRIDHLLGSACLGNRDPIDCRVKTRTGVSVPFLFIGTAINPGEVLCMALDLTERERMETELARAERLATVGRLAGGVAHDFNNLLTIVVGHCDLLLTTELGPSEREAIEAILRAGTRAAEVSRRLLVFSRQQPASPARTAVNDVALAVHAMTAPIVKASVDYRLDLAPEAWDTWADASLVEHAVINLVVNARDAMPGGGRLVLRTTNVHLAARDLPPDSECRPGDYVAIAVEDTGTGIAPDALQRIFEPFFTTKGPAHGTGLGLAVVHGTARSAGGFVSVRTSLGHGTTFAMHLPRLVVTR